MHSGFLLSTDGLALRSSSLLREAPSCASPTVYSLHFVTQLCCCSAAAGSSVAATIDSSRCHCHCCRYCCFWLVHRCWHRCGELLLSRACPLLPPVHCAFSLLNIYCCLSTAADCPLLTGSSLKVLLSLAQQGVAANYPPPTPNYPPAATRSKRSPSPSIHVSASTPYTPCKYSFPLPPTPL